MKQVVALTAGAVALASCAARPQPDTRVPELEKRVAALEARLAEMEAAAPAATAAPQATASRPQRPRHDDVPIKVPRSALTHDVSFEVGDVEFYGGDSITIEEIRGDRPTFEVGGNYVVRGTYRLVTLEQASLELLVTAVDPVHGFGSVSAGARTIVQKGEGKFELAKHLTYVGKPHLTFFRVGTYRGIGGVYFGAGAWLLKNKPWRYENPVAPATAKP